ncbi:MAG: hypothetical protein IPI46_11730 [Bacteroidetes bacterium]|nr:hypothetical protein [Bacteroidota bacterium]
MLKRHKAFPYQSALRNSSGGILANQNVSIRFSIHDSTTVGTIVYQETHAANTNNLGLVSLQIGTGTPVISQFNLVNWAMNAKFLQIEMIVSGGTSYTDLGTQQMMSVPFALYAEKSGSYHQTTIIGFSASSTWLCPSNVTMISVELWSGGGGGGGGGNASNGGGGHGGSGGNGGYIKTTISVLPNIVYNINVGVGGNGGIAGISFQGGGNGYYGIGTDGQNGLNGGISSFDSLVTVNGGNGGSGGAAGSFQWSSNLGQMLYSLGANGIGGANGPSTNYNYPYNSLQQQRSYLPTSYIPVYPGNSSIGGAGGNSTLLGTNGENGYVIISY